MNWEEQKAALLDGLTPARRATMEEVLNNQKVFIVGAGGAYPKLDFAELRKVSQRLAELEKLGTFKPSI